MNSSITITHAELAAIVAKAVAAAMAESRPQRSSGAERTRPRLYPRQSEWRAIRAQVLARDGHRCTYCGSAGGGFSLHCDHVLAITKGGDHSPANLTTACQTCNSSKKAESVETWRAKRGL